MALINNRENGQGSHGDEMVSVPTGAARADIFVRHADVEKQRALLSENKNKTAVLKQRFLEGAKVTNFEKGYITAPEFNLVIDPDILMAASEVWRDHYRDQQIDYVVGLPEAGDRLAPALAILLGAKLLPARKAEAVPASWRHIVEYENESFTTGEKGAQSKVGFVEPHVRNVLLVDDVIAKGNTGIAAIRAFEKAGANVVGLAALFAKQWQGGQERIKQETGVEPFSIINILCLTPGGGFELE